MRVVDIVIGVGWFAASAGAKRGQSFAMSVGAVAVSGVG
jgi:hypothetical protein